MEQFSHESIQQRVRKALEKLILHDAYLLKIDSNERSITHRLGMYLQEEFERWDVDCEYNRDYDSPDLVKRLQLYTEPIQADDFIYITPDFAVSEVRYVYEEAIQAGSDHALVVADLIHTALQQRTEVLSD